MAIKESYNLEFKVEVSRSYLKTVSAYANYNEGEIIFGIDDDGIVKGLPHVKQDCLRIENMIYDSIVPVPPFAIEVTMVGDEKLIHVAVKKGKDTPYYYQVGL